MKRLNVSVFLAGLAALIGFLAVPGAASSLFERGVRPATGPVPLVRTAARADDAAFGGGSLFADRRGGGLFAPVPPRLSRLPDMSGLERARPALRGPRIDALRALIATVEAGPAQYDAVVFSARIKPPQRPTQMTLAEIFDWIDATPGQNHAIGRFQFIPPTLRDVANKAGVPMSARFTPSVQDRLADVLLRQAGLIDFLAGHLPRKTFMNNLARIWAGLPNSTGRSHYAGIAGNKAGMSWTRFTREMARIFPEQNRS